MGLLDGKVAIVTGSGGGIGRCHALALAKEGAKIVVNDVGGDRSGAGTGQAMADVVVDEIKALGGEAAANYDSVATLEGGKAIVQTAIDAFGRLDILGVQEIESEFLACTASRKKPTLVDMSEVSMLTSFGMGMLIKCAKELETSGAKMVLLNPQELVEEILNSAGLERMFAIAHDEDEALEILQGR